MSAFFQNLPSELDETDLQQSFSVQLSEQANLFLFSFFWRISLEMKPSVI